MRRVGKSIKKSLCGLLSAAMLMTSIAFPSIDVLAEEAIVEEVMTAEIVTPETETISVEELLENETGDNITLAEATSANFYYYIGDVDSEEKVGMYVWCEDGTNFITSASVASWYVWAEGDTYEMTAVAEHAGWYMIPVTIADISVGTTMKVYRSSNAGSDTSEFNIGSWNNTEMYNTIFSGENDDAFVKDATLYASFEEADGVNVEYPIEVTLNMYSDEDIDSLDFVFWSGSPFETTEGTASELVSGSWNATAYKMTPVDENAGWYMGTLKINANGSGSGFEIWAVKDGKAVSETKISAWDNTELLTLILEKSNGESIAIRNGKAYSDIDSAEYEVIPILMKSLIASAEGYNQSLYTEESWNGLIDKKTIATTVISELEDDNEENNPSVATLRTTYAELKEAVDNLVTKKISADINVTPVAMTRDFITGADLSSYLAVRDSGVVFKDENGNALSDQEFFDYLADGGTNWVRIRVWNDPYDGSGNGYGGGNNDIDKAITLGKLATNAEMRVLIDFHYSDFWADPAKYSAPKAFKNMTLEEKVAAVGEFTTSSLRSLRDAGVDVGMVQVGNETNSGICGETSWDNMAKIFEAGSSAVRAFDESILIAVHYTDPQNGFTKYASKLDSYGIDYDVFGASFYPYWHGTTSQLTASLTEVATTYNKKVMVAETSWATTWEDGDGHENTAPKTSGQALNYDISIQGQADEMRDVVNAVNNATNGIGVFYWEPAWISQNYVYNSDGSIDNKLLAENKTGWEKYGSGWAASYSTEYDPSDAGLWYGGSAIDNQSWFDFDGTALATAKAYALIRTGAVADKSVSQVTNPKDIEVSLGESVVYPSEVAVKFNDGTTGTATVKWNSDEIAMVSTDKLGSFKVTGVATCTFEGANGTVTEKRNVAISVTVVANANLLKNPGFENGYNTNWAYYGSNPSAAKLGTEANNVRSGSSAVNFYFDPASDFTMSQTVNGLTEGLYTFGAFMQGGSAGSTDKQYSFVEVYNSDDVLKVRYSAKTSLSGWLNWNNPEIRGIKVEDGDYLVVGLKIMSTESGAWGWIDDAYLYGSYSVNVDESIENGLVSLSNYEASAGEMVTITAKPNTAYRIKTVSLSGNGLAASNVEAMGAVLDSETGKYVVNVSESNKTDAADFVFTMPDSEVTVSAEFESIFASDKINIGEDSSVVIEIADQYYSGKNITPAVKITYKGYVLTSADYSVTYKNNKEIYVYNEGSEEFDANVAPTAIITGKGSKFTGTKKAYFVIGEDSRIDLADKNNVTVKILDAFDNTAKKSFYYRAEEIEPSIEVSYKDGDETKTLAAEKYTVVYSANVKPGTATITVVPADVAVKSSAQINFIIEKRPVSTLSISAPSGATYSGKAIKPVIRVKYGNKTLVSGTDYTVAYSNNVKASSGTAFLTVTGKGNYVGKSDKIYFNISQKNIKDTAITMTAATLNEVNRDQSAKVTLTNTTTGKNLTAADYSITKIEKYDDSTSVYTELEGLNFRDAGTYRVTAEGKNNYTGEKSAIFKVIDAAHNITNAKIKTTGKTYTGSSIVLSGDELVVTAGSARQPDTLVKGTDYSVKYVNNQKVGTATVIITGMGAYSGSKSATFKIAQAKIKNVYGAEATVEEDAKDYIQWNIAVTDGKAEDTSYTGYAIAPTLKVTYGANKNVLVKDKDYTVAYSNNVKSGAEANIVIRGKGNYSGSVTVKKAFVIEDRSLDDFIVSVAPVEYTGKAIKPEITFTNKATGENVNLKAGTAYTVTYKNNTNVAGKNSTKAPTVTIKETGLNGSVAAKDKNTATYKFTITSATIKNDSVAKIAIQKYAGKAVTPQVTVKVNGRTLKKGKDYIVTFSGNAGPGTAIAEIKGTGNYTGTVRRVFTIK